MRVLICIGCDEYQDPLLESLSGAERDARRVYEALLRQDLGDYDASRSILLRSPTLAEVRRALLSVLHPSLGKIDCLTFFFAGHGNVHAGSFYMLMKDTAVEAQSLTAYSLSDLFRAVNDVAPGQTNLIIDACRSGGLIKDLGALLASDRLGEAHSPGVTLLGTAAMDQYASETSEGGSGTVAILDCIEGREFVQDHSPTLDLLEIGRRIASARKWVDQNPVVWGLNLLDLSRFCKNPRFSADPTREVTAVLREAPVYPQRISRQHYESLWRAYASVSESRWDAREFTEGVQAALADVSGGGDLVPILGRLVQVVAIRAHESPDAFRAAQARAAIAVSLLPHLHRSEAVQAANVMLSSIADDVVGATRLLIDDLKKDEFALLRGSRGGLLDLYHLPQRISSILAWSAAVQFLTADEQLIAQAEGQLGFLLQASERTYAGSMITVSDSQAPSVCVLISVLIATGRNELAEEILGRHFHSIIQSRLRIARCDLAPALVLDFLLAKAEGRLESIPDLLEQPGEMLTVLLVAAAILKLQDALDPSFWKIDRCSFAAFVPDSYQDFHRKIIESGRNYLWQVGFDVFNVAEFSKSWPEVPQPATRTEAALAVLSSLLYPDRIPWFALTKFNAEPYRTA